MAFRSSFCRMLRSRSLRAHSTVESPLASGAAESVSHTGFLGTSKGSLSGGKHGSRIDSIYGNRAAISNGLQSLRWTHMSGYDPSYASGIRAMHWITSLDYQRSGKIQGPNSKASLEVKRGSYRFYSVMPDLPFPVMWTLIGANVAVFMLWHKLDYKFMERHFLVSMDSVLSGRLHTILTSAFSQRNLDHLISNLIGLYFFGSVIERSFGEKYLLALYLAGAIGGSVGHLLYYAYFYRWVKGIPQQFYNKRYTPGALGASGAVTSVIMLDIFLYPQNTVLLFLVIPMPAALLGALIIGRDLWLARQGNAETSVGGHLGGTMVGILAFLAKKAHWF